MRLGGVNIFKEQEVKEKCRQESTLVPLPVALRHEINEAPEVLVSTRVGPQLFPEIKAMVFEHTSEYGPLGVKEDYVECRIGIRLPG